MAEQQRHEETAGKQLERVQGQMAEFIYPVKILTQIFGAAYNRAAFECGCDMANDIIYANEWISPPTQPYATVFNGGNPESFKRLAANPRPLCRRKTSPSWPPIRCAAIAGQS
jgi:hypothetical protein